MAQLRSDRITGMELTPAEALLWRTEKLWKSNRQISELHLQRMIRVHMRDDFPETEAIQCTINGDDVRNLDGGHRAEMVLRTQKPLWLNVKDFNVENEKQRRELWKKIDRGRARLYAQAIDADEWDEAGYQNKQQMIEISAIAELVEGKLTLQAENSRFYSHEEKSEFAFEWATSARVLYDPMVGAPNIYRNLVRRKHVMAVLLPLAGATANREKMAELVECVSHNKGLLPKTPGYRLFLELQRDGSNLRGRAAVEFMRRVAYCCVRHLNDEQCINIPTEVPVALPGTDIVVG